ncbi:dynamin family protein [Gluconobacter cerinus]|uniref:dynamin family protein n=1 Tax=Gluconobacter cerinus TaxID=38307 RepID=UPI001B8B3EE5|nr:dynamin family protein [Gluconobacter cerinus]MBS1034962.1 dynamin family protein [Gluconobacter cerinus]
MNETAHPTLDLKGLFRDCAAYWQQRTIEITSVADDIEKTLSDRLDSTRRESLTRKREALGNAVQTLLEHVKSPELILATTGTTSSGKSTLANFLIGDSLLPSAVQEMSAGLVTVRHHDQRHTLKIASTRGATWDTGEWDDLSAEELRARLEETMEQFRAAEKENPSIEAVHFEIDWPIRLAGEKVRFGLPEGTRITILDLPGLKAMNDERNGPIIRKNITQALCLVAYNAEETDDRKQKELLNQVINQVTSWRKTSSVLGRMLFLLNRIDAFSRNDSNPDTSLNKFRSYVTQQLRGGLINELPEEKVIIDGIEPATISSLPALWAVEAGFFQSTPEKQQDRLEKIEANFKTIFPKGYWKTYPRDFEELTGDLRRHLIADTLRYSHASDFERRLGEHIAANLPEIALAGPMDAVSKAANELLIALDQTLEAHMTRTEEEAATAKKRLAEIEDLLTREAEDAIRLLEKLNISHKPELEISAMSTFLDIREALDYIGRSVGKPGLLAPIKNLSDDVFKRPLNDLADYAKIVMRRETPVPSPLMIGIPTLAEFTEALEKLQASPYGRVWQSGGRFSEGSDGTAVKSALNEFGKQLSIIINFIIPVAANQSGDRIGIVFKECASLLINGIEEKGGEALEQELQAFPGLKTIFDGEITFPSFKGTGIKLIPKIENWHRTEIREKKEISHERSIWTLYLYVHEVERCVNEEYEIRGISVAGLGDLFAGFHRSTEIIPLVETFKKYIYTLVDVFSKYVTNKIEKGIDGYKRAIDQSIDTVDQKKELDLQTLKQHKSVLIKLLNASVYLPEWKQAATLGGADVV